MVAMPMPARRAEGLYHPQFEHDACGVAFVAQLSGEPAHEIVAQGITALENLDHRGATGADAAAGDGAGMLLQVPDRLLRETVGFDLPPVNRYAVGLAFLQGQYATDYPALMSGALLSSLPVLLLFAVAQRSFVAGLSRTGLK